MRLSDLEKKQAALSKDTADATRLILEEYKDQPVSTSVWLSLLRILFGFVLPTAEASAKLSRRFYDEERSRVYPEAPRNDVLLSLPSFDRFVEDMEEVRPRFAREGSTDVDVHVAGLRAARTVENAGRWTIMRAVEEPDDYLDSLEESEDEDEQGWDQETYGKPKRTNGIRGWARVATGRETCGWCLMLVSRGPVYSSQSTAGSRMSTRDSLQLTGSGEFDAKQHMHAWHTGCDCKVVPVFDLANWEGRSRHKAAELLWKQATDGVFGKEAIRAFSKAVEAGEYAEMLKRFR